MKILAVESSAKTAGIAVCEFDYCKAPACISSQPAKIIVEFTVNSNFTHSQTLVPMIREALEHSGQNLNEIDYFAVSAGPGSFTGLRIGIAAVKGLAFALDKPCVPVSTLYALAENLIFTDGIISPVMDARCNQVYNSLFLSSGGSLTRLCDDRALSTDELFSELEKNNKNIFFVGDGTEICYKKFREKGINNCFPAPPASVYQKASSVAIAAYKKLTGEQSCAVNAHELVPVYLRLPQAERMLAEKNIQKGCDIR